MPPASGGITDEGWSLLAGLGVELAALGAVLFTHGVHTGKDLLGAQDVGGHDGVVGDRVRRGLDALRDLAGDGVRDNLLLGASPPNALRMFCEMAIEQNFGPHIEQKCAILAGSAGRVSSWKAMAVSGS